MYLQRVISKKNSQKINLLFWLTSCQQLTGKAGSGSGSVSQWYGSLDPDPDRTAMSWIHITDYNNNFLFSFP